MYYGLNRYLCDVLDDMRKCIKTNNYSYLASLIEECQVLGNRMESALRDQKDLDTLHGKIRDAKQELKSLKDEIKVNERLIKVIVNKS